MQPIIDTPTLTAIMHDMMHQYAGFTHFADRVQTHTDEQFIYIESNGMANHPMMIGIRNWQQQVPIPQNYTQQNAWRVPLDPQPAATPISTATALYSGAIAIAVNGVPII